MFIEDIDSVASGSLHAHVNHFECRLFLTMFSFIGLLVRKYMWPQKVYVTHCFEGSLLETRYCIALRETRLFIGIVELGSNLGLYYTSGV